MDQDEIDAHVALVNALVSEAAAQANYQDPSDAVLLLPDSSMINDMETARREVELLASERPWLIIPEEQPDPGPPPPTPGHHTMGGRGQPRKPLTPDQMWLGMFQGMGGGGRRR